MTSDFVPAQSASGESLSYKFQRLRERVRQAVVSGELSGKLPGERELAKRFKANPKTLSKALTDLAAEGLLERSIGRGTYVKGSAPQAATAGGKWLILVNSGEENSPLVEQLLQAHGNAEVETATASMRPSFITQFDAVIDVAAQAPENLHRDLLVRGISVLLVDREPLGLKVHAVALDRAHAAAGLARDIFLAGHRRLLVVESGGSSRIAGAVRTAGARYAPHASVEAVTIVNTEAIVSGGYTAFLFDSVDGSARFRELAAGHPHLQRSSFAAVGVSAGPAMCTGIFASPSDLTQAAVNLMRDAQIHRPTVLWLTGTYVEKGTIRVVAESRFDARGEATALSA